MEKIKVILIGQPNVGKSQLINSITGSNLRIGNFTGVTVEKKEIVFFSENYEILITDLPGIYSLNVYSPEEQITKDYLLNEEYDIILNVLDSNAMQKNLSLTLQLLDMNKKILLALNMIDETENAGIKIDNEIIWKLLGIPVLPVSAKEKIGLDSLIKNIIKTFQMKDVKNRLQYNDNIEKSVKVLGDILLKNNYSAENARFYSIRLLENDNEIYRLIHDKVMFLDFYDIYKKEKEILCQLENESDSSNSILSSRSAITKFITEKSINKIKKDKKNEKLDKILMNKYLGLPIFLFFMWLLFQLTFTIGAYPVQIIEKFFEFLSKIVSENINNGTINKLLSEGLIPGIGAVISFLPNILILFMGISILEQSGYMARVAYLLDGTLKKFGLPGKAFIPMITGFGCSIPAYMAARTLKNPKDKLITMLVISFFSCPARLPVYILFVSALFPKEYTGNILFGIYLTGIVLALLIAKLFRVTLFQGEMEPFVMELPKYRLPSIKRLGLEFKIKSIIFLKRAGVYIGAVTIIIWVLSNYPQNLKLNENYINKIQQSKSSQEKIVLENELKALKMENSFLGIIGKTIEPIFAPLGFDWKMSVAVITALAAKEVAVSTLATLNHINDSEDAQGKLTEVISKNVPFKSGIAFLIIVMIYSPCFAAITTFLSEVKEKKWRIFYILYPNILAWCIAFITVKILGFAGL